MQLLRVVANGLASDVAYGTNDVDVVVVVAAAAASTGSGIIVGYSVMFVALLVPVFLHLMGFLLELFSWLLQLANHCVGDRIKVARLVPLLSSICGCG